MIAYGLERFSWSESNWFELTTLSKGCLKKLFDWFIRFSVFFVTGQIDYSVDFGFTTVN